MKGRDQFSVYVISEKPGNTAFMGTIIYRMAMLNCVCDFCSVKPQANTVKTKAVKRSSTCASAGITRPLLVTDKGLSDLPVTAATLEIMRAAGLGGAMFSDVDPNPNE